MLICACCGRYWREDVTTDGRDGTPPRKTYRLRRGRYIIGEYRTLRELDVELDKLGILMWPDDGGE